MTDVVNEGTGGAAALGEVQVAGKTGTAEIDIDAGHQPGLVHRLRARRRPADRGRRHGRAHAAARAAPSPRRSRSRCSRCCSRGERPRTRRADGGGRKGTVVDERYKLDRKIGSRRHGRRLARRRHRARPQGRDQDPARPLRPGQGVRRALPPRGAVRGRPPAPQRGQHLRPRRVRGHLLHRDGVRGRPAAQGAGQGRHGDPGRDRLHPPDPRTRPASPTARGSSTAT